MADRTKDVAEQKVNEGRSLSRNEVCCLSYDFVNAALNEGKRIVIELDEQACGAYLKDGTENGFEIRTSSESLNIIGGTDFNQMDETLGCNKKEGLRDYFDEMASGNGKKALYLTNNGKATNLVLTKAHGLDGLKRKP